MRLTLYSIQYPVYRISKGLCNVLRNEHKTFSGEETSLYLRKLSEEFRKACFVQN